MSEQVSRAVIDSLEFARTGQTLRGSLPIAGLVRLRESLQDALGQVEYVVRGGQDSRQRLTLSLEVSGVLHLQCQRCLGRLDFPVRLAGTLVLGSAQEAAAAALDEDESDWIEASPALDVESLVEDEIILGLPFSPRHPENECGAGANRPAENAREPAFGKLAALKRTLN